MHFWLPIFSAVTAALGLLFTLLLWRQKDNRQVNRWLAALMFAITLVNVGDIFAYAPIALAVPDLSCCLDWAMFLAAPIGYQYVRAMTGHKVFSRRAWWLHGLPAVLSVIILIFWFYLKPYEVKLRMAQENLTYGGGPDLFDSLYLAAAILMMIYLLASVQLVRGYRDRLKDLVAEPYINALRLRWLVTLLVVFFILVSFEILANATSLKFFDFMTYMMPSISLYTLALIGFSRPQVFTSDIGLPDVPTTSSSGEPGFSGGSPPADGKYRSCFMSYSTRNQQFADQLYKSLMKKNMRCWFAPADLKIGVKFRDSIEEAIHQHDKLLLVISNDSIQSFWVEFEVEVALGREKREDQEVVFPVKLDQSIQETQQKWAMKLHQTRHIGDFCNWRDPVAYKRSLERLCRDLKSGKVSPRRQRKTDQKK